MKTLVLEYCPTEYLWKAPNKDVLHDYIIVCVQKIDLLFGQKDYSKPLILTFSNKPTKKKGERIFDCCTDNSYFIIYYKKKYIPTYSSLSKWIKKNFPHLKTKDKLYVRAFQ